jgi:hypothetical protein
MIFAQSTTRSFRPFQVLVSPRRDNSSSQQPGSWSRYELHDQCDFQPRVPEALAAGTGGQRQCDGQPTEGDPIWGRCIGLVAGDWPLIESRLATCTNNSDFPWQPEEASMVSDI